MGFSKEEKMFIFKRASVSYVKFVEEQHGKECSEKLFQLLFARLSDEEFEKMANLQKVMGSMYLQREKEFHHAMFESEYKSEEISIKGISQQTLQICLFILWKTVSFYTTEDKSDEEIEALERVNDQFFGYLNREMILNPLVSVEKINSEYKKQKDIVENVVRIFLKLENDSCQKVIE